MTPTLLKGNALQRKNRSSSALAQKERKKQYKKKKNTGARSLSQPSLTPSDSTDTHAVRLTSHRSQQDRHFRNAQAADQIKTAKKAPSPAHRRVQEMNNHRKISNTTCPAHTHAISSSSPDEPTRPPKPPLRGAPRIKLPRADRHYRKSMLTDRLNLLRTPHAFQRKPLAAASLPSAR